MADAKKNGKDKNLVTANDVKSWDCASNPTERVEEMFVNLIQRQRIARGQTPARRTVFLKPHGVAHGWLEPKKGLKKEYKVGTFAHGILPC
jgi:hypothetical protein